MKYLIASVSLVSATLLVWAWQHGTDTFIMMVIAILCVILFGAAPVIVGARISRRKATQTSSTRIVVRSPHPQASQPADASDTPKSVSSHECGDVR